MYPATHPYIPYTTPCTPSQVGAALLVASYLLLLCGGAAALLLGLVGGAARNAAAHEETYALYRARWVLRAEGSLLGQLLRSRQLRCGGHDHAYTPMEPRPDGGDGGDGAARYGGSARHRGAESWGLEVEEVAAGLGAGSDGPDGWRLSAGAAARAAWAGEEGAVDAGRGAARDDTAHWHGAARRQGVADDARPRREVRGGGGGGGALEAAWAGQACGDGLQERFSGRDDARPAFGAGGASGGFGAGDAAVEEAVARLEARLGPLVSQLQRAARDAASEVAVRSDYGAPREARTSYGVEEAWQAEAGGAAEARLNAQGVLVVTLQHASGLKPMDRNGSSDPYAKLSLAGGTRTSKVVVSQRPDPPATLCDGGGDQAATPRGITGHQFPQP